MDTPLITALFYGISGAGKGTQAALLTKYLELEAPENHPVLYIETGEHFRGFIRGEGYTNKRTAEIMDAGELLPAFLPIYLWGSILVNEFDNTQHLLLDGLARRASESPILDSALTFYGRDDYHVFVLDISDEVAAERLRSRGREDDKSSDEVIRNKIEWYRHDVVPAIEEFERMGRNVHHINGEQSIEAIHQEVLSILGYTN